MNRRSFLQSAALLLCPSLMIQPARRRINLMQFCGKEGAGNRYDFTLPFTQQERTYATDGHIAVCVAPLADDRGVREGKIPPAAGLPYWDHERRQGWRAMRPQLFVAEGWCPDCDGTGLNQPQSPCAHCVDSWGCDQCDWKGVISLNGDCAACQGAAHRRFPSIAKIGDNYFDAAYVRKLAGLDVEYQPSLDGTPIAQLSARQTSPPMRFRFDGGVGLWMPLEEKSALTRING